MLVHRSTLQDSELGSHLKQVLSRSCLSKACIPTKHSPIGVCKLAVRSAVLCDRCLMATVLPVTLEATTRSSLTTHCARPPWSNSCREASTWRQLSTRWVHLQACGSSKQARMLTFQGASSTASIVTTSRLLTLPLNTHPSRLMHNSNRSIYPRVKTEMQQSHIANSRVGILS